MVLVTRCCVLSFVGDYTDGMTGDQLPYSV